MRRRPSRVDGIDFPVSAAPIVEGNQLRYVPPPSNSFDWAGADWESPVSLSFETKVLDAQKFAYILALEDTDASLAFRRLHSAVVQMKEMLTVQDVVLDPAHRIRMTAHPGMIRFLALTWPAVPGATTYPEDDTR